MALLLTTILLIVLPASWVLLTWMLKVRWERRHLPGAGPYTFWRIIRATLSEVVTILIIGWWHLTGWLRASRLDDLDPSGPLVICLHGYMQNATNMHGVRRQAARVGLSSTSIQLGLPGRSMDSYTATLRGRLQPFAHRRLVFVCHSMGGIILRQLLRDHPGWADRIEAAITIGTPHEGTAAASLGLLPETRALQYGSPYIQSLPPLSAHIPMDRILSIGSADDATVFPESTTLVVGTKHLTFQGMGHSGLLVWPSVLRTITDWIKKVPDVTNASGRS